MTRPLSLVPRPSFFVVSPPPTPLRRHALPTWPQRRHQPLHHLTSSLLSTSTSTIRIAPIVALIYVRCL